MNVPNTILALLGGIALTLFSLWFGQNHHLLPVSATEVSPQVDRLFDVMLTISTGLFLLVQGALIYAIIRFRQKPGDESDGPPIRGNIPLEVLWTALPAVTILGLSVYSFEVYGNLGGLDPMTAGGHAMAHHHSMGGTAMAAPLSPTLAQADPNAPAAPIRAGGIGASSTTLGKSPDVTIDVQGLQYAWLFTYPGGILTGELHVPLGQDVQLNLVAQDVLHAFWVPQFRLKQDAIPGRTTELRFKATVAGHYPIVCAELCGAYHGAMRSELVVESPEEYQTWLASFAPTDEGETAQSSGPQLAIHPPHTDSDYLQPYSDELGATREAIAQLAPRL